MAETEDVNSLKRRGRRRLVGAIALVLAAVIVLPMVFDSEPRRSAPPVSVRIPGEDESGFTPKVTPKISAPAAPKLAEKTVGKALEKPAEKIADKAPAAPQAKPAAAADQERARAEAAEEERAERALTGEQYMVPAGAFIDPAAVIEKLKDAKIPFYTEPIATKRGPVTRVRAGPFASRDAAEKVLQQLKGLGLKPGNIAAKS